MNLTHTELNGLYLGITPIGRCGDFIVYPLEVKDIVQCVRQAEELCEGNELYRKFLEKYLVAYKAVKYEDFDDFLEYDESDIDEIIEEHERVLAKCPKVDTLTDKKLEEFKEYFKNHSMLRWKWKLCKDYNIPPNKMFGTGDYISDTQQLWVFVNQCIDNDEKRTHYCDKCWEKMTDPNLCHNCGEIIGGGDSYKSTTFSDDEWERRAHGVYNKETGVWELPVQKIELIDEEPPVDYSNQVEETNIKYIERELPEEIDEPDGFIELGVEEPQDFDDFDLVFEDSDFMNDEDDDEEEE